MNKFQVEYAVDDVATTETLKFPFLVQYNLPKDINFSMYRHKHTERRPNSRLLVGQYDGEQYTCTFDKTRPINYAIGLIDPKNSTITVRDIPILSVTTQDLNVIEEESTLDATSDLVSFFGSKRSKRIVNSMERKRAQKPAIEFAEKALKSSSFIDKQVREISSAKENSKFDSRKTILPPFHTEGISIETFYPFDEFIPQDLLKFCKPIFLSDYPSPFNWVRERFVSAQTSHKDYKLVQKLFQLTLMHYMLTFANLSKSQLEKLSPSPKNSNITGSVDFPPQLLEYFLDLFTDTKKGRVQLSTNTNLRMYCYICILALWIEGMTGVSIIKFAQELPNLTISKLEKIFKQVGCIIRKRKEGTNTSSYAILQFPPTFPK